MINKKLISFALFFFATAATAQESEWDVTIPRGQTRTIEFTTTEGTFISVDISPDGAWVVFDLLGHVYRVLAAGGDAECLTCNSGIALNYNPRYAPDGTQIAFISDRKGQNNLWIMDADGENPRPVTEDLMVRAFDPEWTPDGRYLMVRRQEMAALGQPAGGSGIWLYHVDGGSGVEIVGSDVPGAGSPSASPDGRYVYFHASEPGTRDPLLGAFQLRRLDLQTGRILELTHGAEGGSYRGSSGGAYAPEVSPDGRYLAFARRVPDGRIAFKGHEFGPRTALWLRDLETGEERLLMDPIAVDLAYASSGYTQRVLPGFSWSGDGRSVVITQGGKIRRVEVATGEVTTIPFTARVHREISEMAYRPFRIPDQELDVKFLRWHTGSPDGRRMVFQAVGRLWIVDLPSGTPRRLTPDSFEPFEFSPAWSPDGRWLAFTTWNGPGGGHLWRVRSAGGEPEQLTRETGEYVNPAWSPDGMEIALMRGSGASLRGQTFLNNPFYRLVRVPAAGGTMELVTEVEHPAEWTFLMNARRQVVRPSWGPDGRIFFPERENLGEREYRTNLVSVRPDGSDRRVHLTFPDADEVVPSPDGQWVAFQEADNVYLMPVPRRGLGRDPLHVEKRKGSLPVRQLTLEGGLFPRWRDASTLEYGSGERYFVHRPADGVTDTAQIHLTVPRRVPEETIALTGARIITLRDREVVERGDVVVTGGRIACVGRCDTSGADRVVDASGTTIIPGLVDMHAHHYVEHHGILPKRNFEQAIYLAYGVTTSLDNSMWSQVVFPAGELIAAGKTLGSRTYSTGDPLYSGDGSRWNDLSSAEVAAQNVNRVVSWGAVSIKQYRQPRRDQRQWVVDAARKRGVMVTAESGDLFYNLSMVMDGHTGWEHSLSVVPVYRDVARFMGQAGIYYSPTFVVTGPAPSSEGYFFQESDVWRDVKQRRWMPWRQLIPHSRARMLRPETDYAFPLIAQGMADIIAEGGGGAIGSHGQQHGIGTHWEVWMAAAALGPMGALEVASLHGARFLGVEQDIGTIETGKLADLLVLTRNPLDDIRATADIRYVMQAGILYDAETLDEIWPETRAFGSYDWVVPEMLTDDVRPVDYFDRRR